MKSKFKGGEVYASDSVLELPGKRIAVAGMVSPAWGGIDIYDGETKKCIFSKRLSHRPENMKIALCNGFLAVDADCGDLSIFKVNGRQIKQIGEDYDSDRSYSMTALPGNKLAIAGRNILIFTIEKDGMIKSKPKIIDNDNVIDNMVSVCSHMLVAASRTYSSYNLTVWNILTGQSEHLCQQGKSKINLSTLKSSYREQFNNIKTPRNALEINKISSVLCQSYQKSGFFSKMPKEIIFKILEMTPSDPKNSFVKSNFEDYFGKFIL